MTIATTSDPNIVIEDRGDGWIRYRHANGMRWEVHGYCDRRGDCIIGADVPGFGVIEDHADIERAKAALGRERIDSEMDVPVMPTFTGCCPFTYVILNEADGD